MKVRSQMNSYDGLDKELHEEIHITECCADCNDSFDEGDMIDHNDAGDLICTDCRENYVDCYNCGHTTHTNDAITSDNNGDEYCSDCYYETFCECEDCSDELYTDDAQYDDNRSVYLCDYCYDNSRNDDVEWNVFSHNYVESNTDFVSPIRYGYKEDTFNVVSSKRYVGIEIETNYCDEVYNSDVEREINYRVLMSRNTIDEDIIPACDKVVHDGSVCNDQHRFGNEVVMYPRRGDKIVEDAKVVCDAIKGYGGYVSRKCGLHIHIDTRDYDYKHFLVLGLFTKLIEPNVYAWCPPSRLGGNWSRKVSQSITDFLYVRDREDFINMWYDNGGYSDEKYNEKRYHGLNLHCHFQANQGLEIRYHGGTLNSDKIKHWVIFWTNVVDKCWEIAESEVGYDDLRNTEMFKSLYHSQYQRVIERMDKAYPRYMGKGHSIDYKQYMKDSECLRRALGLPKRDKPYVVEPLLDLYKRKHDLAFLSLSSIFDIFEIPTETQKYIRGRIREISDNASEMDIDHLTNCFGGKRAMIEYSHHTGLFKYVDFFHLRLPTIDDTNRLNNADSMYSFDVRPTQENIQRHL